MTSYLFSNIQIGTLQLENRIVIPPMCQYSAANGQATEWHLMHYGNLSLSGAGLLIVEATAIEPEGRISYADLGLWDDKCAATVEKVISFIRLHSNVPLFIQLSHAGRKASTNLPWKPDTFLAPSSANGWQTVAPSAVPLSEGGVTPKELTTKELESIIEKFATAAERAVSIGFNGIEIHAAHGYLLHQFLSPVSNKRTDSYGGSLENRIRLTLEVIDAIKAKVPEGFPLGIRISATDWIKDGWDLEQSVVLSKELEKRGVAYIHVSGGGLDGGLQKLPELHAGYQLPFAEAIKKEVKTPIIGVGLITTAQEAENAIATSKADMIAVGRGMLYDPRWTWHAAAELGAQVSAPLQYVRSKPHQIKELFKK